MAMAHFQAAVAHAAGGSADSVVVADVNGDGKFDVLVAINLTFCSNRESESE
jgi:FG-GAP repeat